ncbi:Protein translocase subunit SecY [Rickettsiales endosymbiont of Paramecium tredecaurelia]|uniref:preprotein translocase subunit SecY n=1 Tax=Candidatus Sarmatiella mevalonica TaxID=2770581 RepID=UPI0019223710|nr:preprotein translocase subunit SecY [Candidatus Sarmatiella mevalonica]MBL3284432.1 Protein translocase subunit SecY [Candidatus Sarmatiella mevalonica]
MSKNSVDINSMFSHDLIKKIAVTLGLLLVCRFGSFIPVPGIDSIALESVMERSNAGVLGMFNVLSGGSLGRMSIFALAIVPYITSSIMVQLLTMIYKPLENLKKDGEAGRRRVNQITRMFTVFLAAFQAYGVAVTLQALSNGATPIVVLPPVLFKMTTVLTLVVGTILLMWIGEQITAFGIGNGSSLIIFVGIVSTVPGAALNTLELVRKGVVSYPSILLLLSLIGVMVWIIIFCERAQRRLTVHYPKGNFGPQKLAQPDTNYIPFKINTAGVIPPMFASSVLLFPTTILNFISTQDDGALSFLSYHLGHGKPLYILLYVLLIVFFSFFYTASVFNADETADNLRKHGAYILGKKPGQDTAFYFDYLLTRLGVIGSVYLVFICLIPEMVMSYYSLSFALSGTSFLIVINVILDTVTQIQSHLFNQRYQKLVKKMRIVGRNNKL